MSKRTIRWTREAYFLWLGGQPAVRLATREEAIEPLLEKGRPLGEDHLDRVAKILEVCWSDPLPPDADHHKFIIGPVHTVLHRGLLRSLAPRMTPSALKRLGPSASWWRNEHLAAQADSEVLLWRPGSPWFTQMDARWPS